VSTEQELWVSEEILIEWVRVCPGMNLADKVAFHLGVTIAALLKVVPLDGAKIPNPNMIEYTDAIIR
jgi:hypothetical protein